MGDGVDDSVLDSAATVRVTEATIELDVADCCTANNNKNTL